MEELKIFNKLDKNTRIRILRPSVNEGFVHIIFPFLPKDNSIRILFNKHCDNLLIVNILNRDVFSFLSFFGFLSLNLNSNNPILINPQIPDSEFLYEPDAFKAFIEPDKNNNLKDIILGNFYSNGQTNVNILHNLIDTTKLRNDILTNISERRTIHNFHLTNNINNIEESLTIFFKDIFVPALLKTIIDTFKNLTNILKEEDKLRKQQQELLRYTNPLITTIEEFVKNNNKDDELIVKNLPVLDNNLQEIEIHGSRQSYWKKLISFIVTNNNDELFLTLGKSYYSLGKPSIFKYISNEKQLLEELEKINEI